MASNNISMDMDLASLSLILLNIFYFWQLGLICGFIGNMFSESSLYNICYEILSINSTLPSRNFMTGLSIQTDKYLKS